MTQAPKICFVTAGGDHPWAMANALAARFGDGLAIVLEDPESKRRLVTHRARRFGWVNALGQLATMALIRFGKRVQAGKVRRFVEREGLVVTQPGTREFAHVPSVNDSVFIEAVERIRPDLVVLAGCRMMRADVLARVPCPVINYHAGVTPKYRGMNGGYWALANGDEDLFGSTIHLVDRGVDTGQILAQTLCGLEPGDTIMTYPYTIAAASRAALVKAVEDMLSGAASPAAPTGESKQWFHPPIWTYLWIGLSKGVW